MLIDFDVLQRVILNHKIMSDKNSKRCHMTNIKFFEIFKKYQIFQVQKML